MPEKTILEARRDGFLMALTASCLFRGIGLPLLCQIENSPGM